MTTQPVHVEHNDHNLSKLFDKLAEIDSSADDVAKQIVNRLTEKYNSRKEAHDAFFKELQKRGWSKRKIYYYLPLELKDDVKAANRRGKRSVKSLDASSASNPLSFTSKIVLVDDKPQIEIPELFVEQVKSISGIEVNVTVALKSSEQQSRASAHLINRRIERAKHREELRTVAAKKNAELARVVLTV